MARQKVLQTRPALDFIIMDKKILNICTVK